MLGVDLTISRWAFANRKALRIQDWKFGDDPKETAANIKACRKAKAAFTVWDANSLIEISFKRKCPARPFRNFFIPPN